MDTPETVEVLFVETRIVDDERKGTYREERYEAGQTYNLNPRSADRWVKRGYAVFASDEDALRAFGASRDVSTALSDTTKQDTGGNVAAPVKYSDMSRADLHKLAELRGLNTVGAKVKGDFITLLEQADAAPPPVNYDEMSDDEIRAAVTERGIDLEGLSSREDAIAALKAANGTPLSSTAN